jgi:hypothetical protein
MSRVFRIVRFFAGAANRATPSQSVNKVKRFHRFIKERNRRVRGVATIYLNRYNALFSKIFANRKTAVDEICKRMTRQDGHFNWLDRL